MATTKKDQTAEIQIVEMDGGVVGAYVLGTTPLIFNRMSEKAKRELLFPKKKSQADKDANDKHEPYTEFRASVYRNKDENAPTRLVFPAPSFKGALMTAALDQPSTRKTEIGRLCWVEGTKVDIYGIPRLFMTSVRSAGMNKSADIRTRAIIERWCAFVEIRFLRPKLNETGLFRLLAAAGVTCGIGDFRQEKGKGNYGQFTLVSADDEEWKQIQFSGGRVAQDKALQDPEPFDDDSRELFDWYVNEYLNRKGKQAA